MMCPPPPRSYSVTGQSSPSVPTGCRGRGPTRRSGRKAADGVRNGPDRSAQRKISRTMIWDRPRLRAWRARCLAMAWQPFRRFVSSGFMIFPPAYAQAGEGRPGTVAPCSGGGDRSWPHDVPTAPPLVFGNGPVVALRSDRLPRQRTDATIRKESGGWRPERAGQECPKENQQDDDMGSPPLAGMARPLPGDGMAALPAFCVVRFHDLPPGVCW